MILNAFILSAITLAPGAVKPAAEENPVPVIIDTLQESHVMVLKEALPLSRTAVSATTLRQEVLNQTGTYRPQALSAQIRLDEEHARAFFAQPENREAD